MSSLNGTTMNPSQPYLTNESELTSIANAIRSKTGTNSSLVYPAEFVSAIGNINTHGSIQAVQNVTPTESAQNVRPDTGYDGLAGVNVGAISTTYVGSGIARKSSSDMSINGKTITAPAGYYASDGTADVAEGSATPSVVSAGISTNPTVTYSLSGSVTNIGITTQPTGTDGTDYWTIVPDGTVTRGNARSKAMVTVVKGYVTTGSTTGYQNVTITPDVTAGTPMYIEKGIITNNTSGGTSSGTINRGNQIMIGAGYYPNDLYYTAQTNSSGTLSITTSHNAQNNISVDGYANVNIVGITVPKTKEFSVVNAANTTTDTAALTVTNNAYRKVLLTNASNGTATITNNGTIDSLINSGTVTSITNNSSKTITNIANNGSVKVTSGSSSAGNLTVSAYKGSTAENNKSIVSGGKWVEPDVSSSGTYYGRVTIAAGSVTQNAPTVNSSGLVTATSTVTAGYVSADTKSNTLQLPTQAAQTITPSTQNQTIESGKYLTGTQTISGDANLIAANIKYGASIFGVSGTFTKNGTQSSGTLATTSRIRKGYTAWAGGVEVKGALENSSVTEGTTTVSGTSVTRGTWDITTGYTDAITIPYAAFASSATSGTNYVDISSTPAAPVLVSGDYLYINQGWTDNLKISLAKLVPDGSDVKGHGEYILSGHSAYDDDGTLVSGEIPTKEASDITASGKTVTVPSGYYASQVQHDIDEGNYSASVTSFSINTPPTVTYSLSGSVSSIGTATKPSGTDGTDYWTITPGGTVVNGQCRAKAKATISQAGYIAAGSTTTESYSTNTITPTVTAGTPLYIKSAGTPTLAGGTVSGTATATGNSYVTLDTTNTSGILVTASGTATRAAVTYPAVTGWLNKASGDEAMAAGSATALTSTDYYITAVKVPKNKPFQVVMTGDTSTDTTSDLDVTNANFRRVDVVNAMRGVVLVDNGNGDFSITWTEGQYYTTNVGTGNVVDVANPSSDADWRSAIIPCIKNDKFILNATGGNKARLWCFVNSSYTVLSASATYAEASFGTITAPTNTAYLIINVKLSESDNPVVLFRRGVTNVTNTGITTVTSAQPGAGVLTAVAYDTKTSSDPTSQDIVINGF